MDTLLDNMFFMFEEEEPKQVEKACMWVVDGDMIRPSTSLTLWNKLTPGNYQVDFHRDYGLYCSKVKTSSDELFKFSESIIPDLLEKINLFWEKSDKYKENKLTHKRGILIYGHPGNGKTSIVSLLSDSLIERKGVVFKVTDQNNLHNYISFIKHSFRSIEKETPIITVLEDIDKYENIDTILEFMDGNSQIEHHIVIATSNNTSRLPDTLLRPSRFDLKLEIPLPSEKIRREFFENKKVPTDQIDSLVSHTENFSIAELKELYISMFLLDYSFDDSLEKIKKQTDKKDYTSRRSGRTQVGL